jgi:hypothetical protein
MSPARAASGATDELPDPLAAVGTARGAQAVVAAGGGVAVPVFAVPVVTVPVVEVPVFEVPLAAVPVLAVTLVEVPVGTVAVVVVDSGTWSSRTRARRRPWTRARRRPQNRSRADREHAAGIAGAEGDPVVGVELLLVLLGQLRDVADVRRRQDLVPGELHLHPVPVLPRVARRDEGAPTVDVHQHPLRQTGVGVGEHALAAAQRRTVPVDDLATLPRLGVSPIR